MPVCTKSDEHEDEAMGAARARVLGLGLALLASACAAPSADLGTARTGSLTGADRTTDDRRGAEHDLAGPSELAGASLDGATLGTSWPAATPDEAAPPRYLATEPDVLLDRRDDGATLTGRPERALAESDPERVLVLVARDGAGNALAEAELEGARVLDARFAGETIVTLGADHVLRAHRDGLVSTLDAGVEAPLSASVSGTIVAYARGEMPTFELARVDVATGEAEALTDAMAPVWSPALSPDGRQIVFVSGATGSPRLYRIEGGGTPTLLPDVGAFPSSLRAPRWDESGTLTFEDEAGARHALDLTTAELGP
jgi:hypothetical protein